MNSTERLHARLRGHPVDRPPNLDILMTYAAHLIGAPLSQYYLDHRVLAEANLAALEALDLDVVQTISDPYREAADIAAASGAPDTVRFPADGLPVLARPLLADGTDLSRLVFPAPHAGRRMADRLEATRLLAERVGGQVPVLGWVEGALAEAADLRGAANLLVDLYDRPAWVGELLERCAELAISFAREQVRAGATIIGLGDALASQVAPRLYRELALPYERRILPPSTRRAPWPACTSAGTRPASWETWPPRAPILSISTGWWTSPRRPRLRGRPGRLRQL